MGPTTAGKTAFAIELTQHLPCEIISVDSAMIYRGMNIGTAKPSPEILQVAPHHLIDQLDPKQSYSAGQFRTDALQLIEEISGRGKIPLLVGGTMLYYKVLHQGIAKLPSANRSLRAELKEQAEKNGWEKLHTDLLLIDPVAAKRIHRHDGQRIQRALEVFYLTGKTITSWQAEETHPLSNFNSYHFALVPADRAVLHARIADRFKQMLEQGFIEEVKTLYERGDLSADLPSMRAVGYKQVWSYLGNIVSYQEMYEQTLAATRQLAKHQLTWLRSWPNLVWLESDAKNLVEQLLPRLHTAPTPLPASRVPTAT